MALSPFQVHPHPPAIPDNRFAFSGRLATEAIWFKEMGGRILAHAHDHTEL
jgi:hypothetical protein